MEIYGGTTEEVPIDPTDLVNKRYVDKAIAEIATPDAVTVVGGVFITDIVPATSGIVAGKTYVLGTVPANAVLESATADVTNVRVQVAAEGGSAFYSPLITVNGVNAVITESPTVKRFFTGYADIVVPYPGGAVVARSSTGASETALLSIAGAGPAIMSLAIGALPGIQTALKSGDVVSSITGIVENSAVYAELIVGGACSAVSSLVLGAVDSGGAGYKTISGSFVAGPGTGNFGVTSRARNSLGTYGLSKVSNTVTLDQVKPTVAAVTFTYPAGQSAIRAGQSVTCTSVISDYSSVAYSTDGTLSVVSPSVYAASKEVNYVSGSYALGVFNYSITATRDANGSLTSVSGAVKIANVAATAAITITGSPIRLISSPTGQSYTVTITSNQALFNAPSLVAGSGVWQGSWTGSGSIWTRVLLINENSSVSPKGAATFNSLVLNGLSGLVGNVVSAGAAYEVGGFTSRTLTFAAFSQYAAIGTNVVNISKTSAKYAGTINNLTRQLNTSQLFQGYTISDSAGTYSATGSHLFITDAAYAGSNTSGTLQVVLEEVA